MGGTPRHAPVVPGPFEAGLRALVVLDAFHPRACSREELALLDHVVVHTADFGGPPSLHPAHAGRAGEVSVRWHLIDEGLRMMAALGFAEESRCDGDARHAASGRGRRFVGVLDTGYAHALRERAAWAAGRYGKAESCQVRAILAELGRRPAAEWVPIPDGDDEVSLAARVARFEELDADYANDLARLSAVADAAMLTGDLRRAEAPDARPGHAGDDPLSEEMAGIEARAEAEARKVARDRAGLRALIRDLTA